MKSAKVFMNGRSQAIRLPREFRVSGKEVYLKKTPEGFLVMEKDPWAVFWEGIAKLTPDSLNWERDRRPAEERDWPT